MQKPEWVTGLAHVDATENPRSCVDYVDVVNGLEATRRSKAGSFGRLDLADGDRGLTRCLLNCHCDMCDGWTGRKLVGMFKDAGFEEVVCDLGYWS